MKVSESKLYNVVAANEAKLYTSKIMPTNNTESVRVFKRSICRYTFIRPVEIINYYNKICYYVHMHLNDNFSVLSFYWSGCKMFSKSRFITESTEKMENWYLFHVLSK